MKKVALFLFAVITLVRLNAFAQDTDSARILAKKLDGYLNSAVAVYKFNGSVLIARKGEIILQKGYGYKNFATKTFNNATGIFQIGSLTKSFTAAVILRLQEEGKLSIDDHLNKYFPQVRGGDDITLRELLNHTSGLYNYTDYIGAEDSAIVSRPVTRQRVLDLFVRKKLLFKPGTRFSYCNSDYYLLGMIIEKVTGMPYETVVRQIIFDALGMTHSGFDFINLRDTAKTAGYITIAPGKYVRNIQWDSTVTYAAGAIYSNPGDLYKFAKAVANNQVLSPASWQQAFTPGLDKYGFGWWIDSLFNRKYIYHSGGLPGFMSYLVYFPDEDVTIIMLTNFGNYGDSLAPMNSGLAAIVFGQPYSLWEKHDAVTIAKEDLKRLAGTYRVNADHSLIITFKKDKLYVEAANPKDMLPQVQLHAETATKFYIKEAQLKFEFVKDAEGNAVKIITYNTRGKDAEWIKVK